MDRAALDVAIELQIPHGGWCPAGRLAEDGTIPDRYQLTETESANYSVRTKQNVLDSGATLILCRGTLKGGTLCTRNFAVDHDRPCLVINLDRPEDPTTLNKWLQEHNVETLNVAGPRESQNPGIAEAAASFFREQFRN